jgi:hypothetical protein
MFVWWMKTIHFIRKPTLNRMWQGAECLQPELGLRIGFLSDL